MHYFNALLPLATAFLGALLGYWAQRNLSERERSHIRADRNWSLIIERGEELYSLIDRWHIIAGTQAMTYRRVMTEELNYNDALDLVISDQKSRPEKFERIQLLLRLYFPDLLGDFYELKKLVSRSGSVEASYRKQYKQGNFDATNHLPLYESLIVETEASAEALLARLASEMRKRCEIESTFSS